jgi:hypothetical protein
MGSTTEQQAQRRPNKGRRYKGVFFHRRLRLWMAQIQVKGKKEVLGYFRTEEEGARIYDIAARKNFGPKAYLNFPERIEQKLILNSEETDYWYGLRWNPRRQEFRVWYRHQETLRIRTYRWRENIISAKYKLEELIKDNIPLSEEKQREYENYVEPELEW